MFLTKIDKRVLQQSNNVQLAKSFKAITEKSS